MAQAGGQGLEFLADLGGLVEAAEHSRAHWVSHNASARFQRSPAERSSSAARMPASTASRYCVWDQWWRVL